MTIPPDPRPRCPKCKQLIRQETRTYADRAEYLRRVQRIRTRAKRDGLTVAQYRAQVRAGLRIDPDVTP